MTPLSPAAQAQKVLDAFEQVQFADRYALAAAILAAVDQVVPVDRGSRRQCNIRAKFLAIAAELDGGTTTPTES